MNKSILKYGLTIAVTIVTFTALAQSASEQKNEHHLQSDQPDTYGVGSDAGNLTLQQVTDQILAQHGGKIIKAELERDDGQSLYEIKGVDADGSRYKVYVNAATGQTVNQEDDD
jgi:uncharacterized membrane protein YkoI